ncbi:MAG: YdeI/OmpD-associated family protein, partial [Pseudomonadota bacterium]
VGDITLDWRGRVLSGQRTKARGMKSRRGQPDDSCVAPSPRLAKVGQSATSEPSLQADSLGSWRRWLKAHHASERIVWLVFAKGAAGKGCLSYDDALDEALCWGWIDSIVRRIDDLSYARKFTPRTNPAKWSSANIDRMRRLLAEGRVQHAGRAVVSEQVMQQMLCVAATRRAPAMTSLAMPAMSLELRRALDDNPQAKTFFESFAPSYRRNYLRWVAEAKRPETRERRANEAVRLLAKGEKSFLK